MIQIENEYGSYGDTGSNPQDYAYMEHLLQLATEKLGGSSNIQFYTTDGGSSYYMSRGTLPGKIFAAGDGGCGDNCEDFFSASDNVNPQGQQAHIDTEYYTGWLTHWGESMANTSTCSAIGGIANLLASNASINLCMF